MFQYLKLARVGNALITFLSVECAGILSGVNIAKNGDILAASIAAALITAGGNAVNDVFDVDIDRINRPRRPIASGRISSAKAQTFYLILTAAGLIISGFISLPVFLIALVASLLVFLYSFKLKRMVFLGNFVVAFLTGLTFIYGGMAVKDFRDVYPAAMFAFLTNLIREIIKDAEDVKGDKEIGVRTIATQYDTGISSLLSILLTALLLVLVWGAYQMQILPIQFLTVCGLTIFPIGVYIIYLLISRKSFSEASFGYKLMMIFGLVALIVGKI